MPQVLDPELRRALTERIRYYNELGIYDFYCREPRVRELPAAATVEAELFQPESREEMPARKSTAVATVAKRE